MSHEVALRAIIQRNDKSTNLNGFEDFFEVLNVVHIRTGITDLQPREESQIGKPIDCSSRVVK